MLPWGSKSTKQGRQRGSWQGGPEQSAPGSARQPSNGSEEPGTPPARRGERARDRRAAPSDTCRGDGSTAELPAEGARGLWHQGGPSSLLGASCPMASGQDGTAESTESWGPWLLACCDGAVGPAKGGTEVQGVPGTALVQDPVDIGPGGLDLIAPCTGPAPAWHRGAEQEPGRLQ